MSNDLDTTVAVYDELDPAEADWVALEAGVQEGSYDIADAALVQNRDGESVILERESHHGWGKGAVAGAVVGILFPPSIIASAAVGAGGGALVARMTRSLGRSNVKDLGETLDSGAMAIVVISPPAHTNAICNTLKGAKRTTTVGGATVEEVQEVMKAIGS